MFSMFPPLPACLGRWIEKKSGKVCFAISFIVLLALASIKEIQEQCIYIATTPFATGISSPCYTLGLKNKKGKWGFSITPKVPRSCRLGLSRAEAVPCREGMWQVLSGPVTGMWQPAQPPELCPILAPWAARASSCQLLSDITHQTTLKAGLFPLKDEFPAQLESLGSLSLTPAPTSWLHGRRKNKLLSVPCRGKDN